MYILTSLLSQIHLPPISLFATSLSGAVLIAVVMLIRPLTIHRLPKATFSVLWGIVLLRLIVPVPIPSRYSVYSLIDQYIPDTDRMQQSAQNSSQTNRSFPNESDMLASSSLQNKTNAFAGSGLQHEDNMHAGSSLQNETNIHAGSHLQKNIFLQDINNLQLENDRLRTNNETDTSRPYEQAPSFAKQHSSPAWLSSGRASLNTILARLTEQTKDFHLQLLWLAGLTVCALFFSASYIKCMRIFSMSLPADSCYAKNWQNTHKIKRTITIRQSDFITTPLTYGILHPVILMPKDTDWEDTQQLQYIFAHEYVHIRRFDAIYKLFLTAACCIHWFNPLVWAMYLLANQDIELSCDEAVVHLFGEAKKSAYAIALIRMEERKSGFAPLCSRFSKNKAEERITAIMKMKKSTMQKTIAACILVASVSFTFATTAAAQKPSADAQIDTAADTQTNAEKNAPVSTTDATDLKSIARTDAPKLSDAPRLTDLTAENLTAVSGTHFTKAEYKKLAALCFEGFQNMTISAYRSKVWDIIDTDEYLELLDRLNQSESLYEQKDSHPAAYFVHYILAPLTAEHWNTRTFGGYTQTSCQNAVDSADLEYTFTLTIKNAEKLTVKEYDYTRRSIVKAIETFSHGRTLEQLKDEKQMQAAIQAQIPRFENDFSSDKISVLFTDYYFSPLAVYEPDVLDSSEISEKEDDADKNDEEILYPARPYEEPRMFPNGGQKKDYASILSLKTADYQKRTAKAFNAALEKCTETFSLDDLAAIWEDITHNDYKITLTDSEKEFLAHTYTLSTLETITETKSRNQNTAKQPVSLHQDLGIKVNQSQDTCNLWFQYGYKISDPSRLTIGERDAAIEQFQDEVKQFWTETSLKQLVTMTKKDMLSYLKKTAAKYSSRYLKITIFKDQVLFQPEKGPEDEF